MIKNITNHDMFDFCKILKSNNFTTEEFLFDSVPYINGMKRIINLTQNTINNSSSNILDLGCGTGLTSFFLSKNAEQVIGIDIYETESTQFGKRKQISQKSLWKSLSNFKHNLKFKFYDGFTIPFKNKSFDLVFLHAVYEHITINKKKLLLDEIYRVLKDQGYLVIARTPNRYAYTEFLTKAHKYKFTKNQILSEIDKNKYQVIHYEKTDFFPEIGFSKYHQNILNYIYPLTVKIDYFINRTPLKIFSHHHFLIFQKFSS